AFQTRDVVDAMVAASGQTITELRVDGGAAAMQLLLQLQADVLGVPVARPVVGETTALGAAYVAGLAEGVWASPDEVAGLWRLDRRVEPGGDGAGDGGYARWQRAVTRARRWATT